MLEYTNMYLEYSTVESTGYWCHCGPTLILASPNIARQYGTYLHSDGVTLMVQVQAS